jgi:hypothetical protein
LHGKADDRRTESAAQHTRGLWGDADAIATTLSQLAEGLAGDWILDEQDVAVVGSMCAITLARQDLGCRERNDLYTRILHLVAEWLQGPSEYRRVAYPFLDAAAQDDELPAYVRNTALGLLTSQAQDCMQRLLAGTDQPPAWLPTDEALGPGLTRLLERIEWLELLRSALGLIHVEVLGAAWKARLVKLANLAGLELATAIEHDQLLAAHPEAFLILAEMMGESWLAVPAAGRIAPLVETYLADLSATMALYAGEAGVHRAVYDEVAALLAIKSLPANVQQRARQFLAAHYPLEDTTP